MSSQRKTIRRKRCCHCHELFYPDARVKSRQHYCSLGDCQKARKRRYQREFRQRHPAEERARRLRERLVTLEDGATPEPPRTRPLSQLPWDEISTELGPQTALILRSVLDVVVRWLSQADSGR